MSKGFESCRYKCTQCTFSSNDQEELKSHISKHSDDKRYSCYRCDYTTDILANLNRHFTVHTDDQIYRCSECSFASSTKTNLAVHLRSHTGEKPFKCDHPDCSYATPSRSNLLTHVKKHTGEKSLACHHCPYKTYSKSALNTHLKRHTGQKNHTCIEKDCKFSCDRRTEYVLHLRLSHKYTIDQCAERLNGRKRSSDFICEYCAMGLYSQQQLAKHVEKHKNCIIKYDDCIFNNSTSTESITEMKKVVHCPLCRYTAYTRFSMREHILNHSDRHEHKCGYCIYSCLSRGNLSRHLQIHERNSDPPISESARSNLWAHTQKVVSEFLSPQNSSEENSQIYQCERCTFTTFRKLTFDKHVRAHDGIKPFACTVDGCEYRTTYKFDLSVHMRRHTGERPFVCNWPSCTYEASNRASITIHKRTHTGIRPFKCKLCSYSCTDNANLKKHVQTHGADQSSIESIIKEENTEASSSFQSEEIITSTDVYPHNENIMFTDDMEVSLQCEEVATEEEAVEIKQPKLNNSKVKLYHKFAISDPNLRIIQPRPYTTVTVPLVINSQNANFSSELPQLPLDTIVQQPSFDDVIESTTGDIFLVQHPD